MLSFSLDLHWARTDLPAAGPQLRLQVTKIELSRARASQHLPLPAYNLITYLAYCLYPPLYIAGPIITFNSFTSQLASPPTINVFSLARYAVRWGAALLALEALTHTLYFNCIAKHRAWGLLEQMGVALGPLHYAEGTYWILLFMWLKFTGECLS